MASISKGVEDLSQLERLDEDSIQNVLRDRYAKDEIYVSKILSHLSTRIVLYCRFFTSRHCQYLIYYNVCMSNVFSSKI